MHNFIHMEIYRIVENKLLKTFYFNIYHENRGKSSFLKAAQFLRKYCMLIWWEHDKVLTLQTVLYIQAMNILHLHFTRVFNA